MLIIKGKQGKAEVLAENFVDKESLIVETHNLQLSKLLRDDIACTVLQIPTNRKEDLRKITETLTSFYDSEGAKYHHIRFAKIIFYLNVNEEDIEIFKKFEDLLKWKYAFVKVILTVQSEDEEIKYIKYE